MNTALARPGLRWPSLRGPRLRAPGLGWLPAVWRRGATWRTVLRFVLLGPLIGGAPYVVFIIPIPFAYAIGALPALVAGGLFATWYHRAGRVPGRAWRALMGALSGAAAAAAALAVLVLAAPQAEWFMVGVIALHGVPAAVVLALLQKPPAAVRSGRREALEERKRDDEHRPDSDQQVREDDTHQRRLA